MNEHHPFPGRRADEPFHVWFRRRLDEGLREPVRVTPSSAVPADFRRAAVLAPLWVEDERVRMVLTLRPQTLPTHRGQIAFPGGSVDSSDTDERAAALRETHEEVGIPPESVRVLGRLNDTWSIQRYHVTPYVGWLDAVPRLAPSATEIDRVIVADVEKLMSPRIHRVERVQFTGLSHNIHYFEYGDDVIWGLTGGIIHDLFTRVRGRDAARVGAHGEEHP